MHTLVSRTHSSEHSLPQTAPKPKGLRTRYQWFCCTNKLPASETNVIYIHFYLIGPGLQDPEHVSHAPTSGTQAQWSTEEAG